MSNRVDRYYLYTLLLGWCLVSLFLSDPSAEAEIIKKGETLSLKRCIEIALKMHPEIAVAKGERMAVESRVGKVKSDYYPQIEIGTGYNRRHLMDTFDQYSGIFTLKQNIYDFSRTETSISLERLKLESSLASIEDTKLNLIFDVSRSYYDLLKAKKNRDVALELVRQSEEHLRQAKGFYEAGTRPRYDVTQAEVNLSNARLNLIKAENNIRLAIASLNNKMGVSEAPEYEIEDDLTFTRLDISIDKILSFALENRPDLRSATSLKRAAEKSVELAKKNYYPNLSGVITYGWSGNSFPLEREWNIGANLTIPVFNGFLTRYQITEAEANLNIAKAKEELIRQKIQLEIQQAYLALREAEERIPTAELAVRQAKENLDLARGRYEAGVGNPIEVTDAEASYANARASYIQAIIDYKIAIAAIKKAMGKDHELW